MKKNKGIVMLALAAAVMMSATACGSKKAEETTAATEAAAAVTDAGDEKTTQETTAAVSSSDSQETTEASTEATTEETKEESAEETTEEAPQVGDVRNDGSFVPSNNRYVVTPPAGWSLDEGSDEQYATFLPENGDDMLELMYLSGDDAEGMVEILPPTAEEYEALVNRDGGMEIVKYDVTTKENGSQTFRYAMRYTNPSDGIRYLAVSGIYDAAKNEYIAASGTVVSDGEDIVKTVQKAVDSFQVK